MTANHKDAELEKFLTGGMHKVKVFIIDEAHHIESGATTHKQSDLLKSLANLGEAVLVLAGNMSNK